MSFEKRNKKRYRVRYDRMFAVLIVFVVLIVILISCTKGCSDEDESSNSNQSSIIDNTNSQEVTTDLNSGNNANSGGQVDTTTNVALTYATESVEYAKMNTGDLALINGSYDYKFTETLDMVSVYDNMNSYYTVSDMTVTLDSTVISHINTMMEAFYNATSNSDLRIIGGYRSLEDQQERANSGKTVFAGGYSDYHSARSFDLAVFPQDSGSGYIKNEGTFTWIYENAANYGFVVRYPEGKDGLTGESARQYTFRYVGIPHAVYMTQNNLCLEEYIDKIKTYTNSNPLAITAGTTSYEVYYVAANANNVTDIPVPSNQTYTISGNNVDGFIVTVTRS